MAEAELQQHCKAEIILRAEQASLERQLAVATAAAAAADRQSRMRQQDQPTPPEDASAAPAQLVSDDGNTPDEQPPELRAAQQEYEEQELEPLRRELSRARDSNALLRGSLKAEAAAAEATHAADAAEIRTLSCQLYDSEQARLRALQALQSSLLLLAVCGPAVKYRIKHLYRELNGPPA